MVLTSKRAWLVSILLSVAARSAAAQARPGFPERPKTAADTAWKFAKPGKSVAFSGFPGQGGGPRPLLFGFALECTRCQPTNRRGGFGTGPLAVWHYQEPPRVAAVVEGSPAARAGIREGDLLLDIAGAALTTDAGAEAFSSLRAGDTASLTLERAGKQYNATLVLGRGGFGRGGPLRLGPQPPHFSIHVGTTAVDVESDVPVISTTDSSGTTTLRMGSTTIRLRPTAPKSP